MGFKKRGHDSDMANRAKLATEYCDRFRNILATAVAEAGKQEPAHEFLIMAGALLACKTVMEDIVTVVDALDNEVTNGA